MLFRCTSDSLKAAGANISVLAIAPRPVVVIEVPGEDPAPFMNEIEWLSYDLGLMALGFAEPPEGGFKQHPCLLRCVGLQRLKTILETGCDVVPTDAVIHVAPPGYKVREYGGECKLIMIFSTARLEPCVRRLTGLTDADIRALKETYPYLSRTESGAVELRRVPPSEPLHEHYSRWISGNAEEALLGLIVAGPRDLDLLAQTVAAISACGRHWNLVDPGIRSETGMLVEILRANSPGRAK